MPNGKRRGLIALAASTALAFALPVSARADSDKPITIVVPYTAGGTNDNFARILAEGISKELGRHVIVENKPGANGIIGASYVARAKPDGQTLLLGGTGPISLNAMLRPSLPYRVDSFDSVALLFDGPLTITVPTAIGVNSIDELIRYAKEQGRPLLYGTLGPGSVTDLFGLLVSKTLGFPMTPVAYKDNNSALIDLMDARGDMNYATPIPMIQNSKKLKILTLTSEQRDPTLPAIPTVGELGYPQLKSTYWTALHAPKGTPREIIDKIAAAAIKTVQTDAFHEVLKLNGQTDRAAGPEALDAQLAADRQHWGTVIRENNIVID